MYNHSPWVHKNEPQYHYKCCLYILLFIILIFASSFIFFLAKMLYDIHLKIYLSLSTKYYKRHTYFPVSVCFLVELCMIITNGLERWNRGVFSSTHVRPPKSYASWKEYVGGVTILVLLHLNILQKNFHCKHLVRPWEFNKTEQILASFW